MKKILNPWAAILTLIFCLGLRFFDFSFIESVRLRYFDTLIGSKTSTVNNIYSVNIDEETIQKYGQYPFDRTVYANLIKDLYARNAGLVIFPIIMSEPDRMGGDDILSKTLQEYPVILANVPADKTKNNPKAPGAAIIGSEYENTIVRYNGIIANIPNLENYAAGVGLTNTFPEIDGVNRRIPLIVGVDGKLYPSLSLEVLRVIAGDTNFQIKLNQNGVEKLRIPQFGPIPTDSLGRVWIDWSQENKKVSMINLPENFDGGLVIVGITAAGISNPLPTSKGAIWPQDVQASIIGTMFNQVNIQRPDWADGAEILAIILISIILLFLTRWTYVGLGSIIIFIIGIAYGGYWAYNSYLFLLDITAPIASIILVSLHAYGIKFVSEFLQKQQIKKQFGTYLSPAMVEKLQKNPDLLKLGGEERELSIMFTDVRGFTNISEHYGKNVQGLTQIMNRYMTAMTAKILENNGTLDKYIGDAQMAFWNAPLDDKQHAKNAVRTALAMLKDLDKFNEEINKEGVPAFGMGIGINTDTVVVGNMGSIQRFDYTCLGDGVNLASRLEGQSKPYGVKIVLGPKTAEQVSDEFNLIELDLIAVKGKSQPVKIYTVISSKDETALKLHEKFLNSYRKGDWKAAKSQIKVGLMNSWNNEMNKYYEIMLERMAGETPENWDGVYRATSK